MDNVRVITFGADTDPTVNIAAGVDSSTHQIDANGDSLTVNIGDGATVGQINANSVTDPAGFTLTAGNNVGVIGSVDGSVVAGAQSNYTIGSNFSTTGNLVGSAAGDATMTIGDGLDVGGRMTASGTGDSVLTVGSNASIGNSLDLRGSGDRTATFGDNASITGNVDVRSTGLNKSVTFGDNANITADVNFLTGEQTRRPSSRLATTCPWPATSSPVMVPTTSSSAITGLLAETWTCAWVMTRCVLGIRARMTPRSSRAVSGRVTV